MSPASDKSENEKLWESIEKLNIRLQKLEFAISRLIDRLSSL